MNEDYADWTPHATIAKSSVAISYYKSIKDFKKEKERYTIPDSVIQRICNHHFNGEKDYYFGDYLFSAIELNEMKLSDDGYYNTLTTIPIPCSNQHLVNPRNFHPIRKPTEKEMEKKEEELGQLPERKSNDYPCLECNLHFPSERQLRRHERIHHSQTAVKKSDSGPYRLKVADGEMELSKEEVRIIDVDEVVV